MDGEEKWEWKHYIFSTGGRCALLACDKFGLIICGVFGVIINVPSGENCLISTKHLPQFHAARIIPSFFFMDFIRVGKIARRS